MGLFDHLAGHATIAQDRHKPGSVIRGTFDPSVASPVFNAGRYGALDDRTPPSPEHPNGEELVLGPVAGPEGVGIDNLRQAITLGALVGYGVLPSQADLATDIDVDDILYLAVGNNNLYGAVVRPALDAVANRPQTGGGSNGSTATGSTASSNPAPDPIREVLRRMVDHQLATLPATGGGRYVAEERAFLGSLGAAIGD